MSTATIPIIFPPLKWYLVLCLYLIASALAFCNSYGTGLTDWSLASAYRKIGLFIIASLVGSNGEVVAGLAACGVMMSVVSTAADLMQDFKTGYLTLSSAKSMFVSQFVGTAMGCVIAPHTFWLFWTAFDIGAPDGSYKAPYAVIFREMAILGIEGFSELPKHCLAICCGFFVATLNHKPPEGCDTKENRTVHSYSNGYGSSVLYWSILCNRHVCRDSDTIYIGTDQLQRCRGLCRGSCIGFNMR